MLYRWYVHFAVDFSYLVANWDHTPNSIFSARLLCLVSGIWDHPPKSAKLTSRSVVAGVKEAFVKIVWTGKRPNFSARI